MLIDRTEKILSLQLEWIKNADAKVPPPCLRSISQ